MPSTLFTSAPEWTWLIVLYFFLGGLAGGSYFMAALLDLTGNGDDRRLARLGYLVAFPAIVLGLILLVVDLGRMERFWHMIIQSKTGWLMFKWWSPISFGTWIISAFTLIAFISFLAALTRTGERPRGALSLFHTLQYGLGFVSKLIAIVGAVLGLAVASYTGWLIAVTNRPIWGDTSLLGLLFLTSGVSTAIALIILLARLRGHGAGGSVHALARMDDWILLLELVVIVAMVVSVWNVLAYAPADWLTLWGLILGIGVVLAGILVPFVLQMRPRIGGSSGMVVAAVLVLVGGLLLRMVVLMSSELLHVVRV